MLRKILAFLLIIALFLPALTLAEAPEEEVYVIKKSYKMKELIKIIEKSDAPIVELKSALSPANVQTLLETFPDKEIRYRLRVGKRTVSWDTVDVDLSHTEYKELSTLTDALDLLPSAKTVTSWGRVFTAEELDYLYETYPHIEKIHCKVKMANHALRTDLTAFCTKHASYTENRYDEEDFAALRYHDDLLGLDIGHNSAKNLDFLYDLPKLKVLIVADNDITDITPIGYQNELQYLELINNEITDLSPLVNCTELIDLHIGKCNVSDITPLLSLTKLERLWLGGNPISEEDLARLQEALPNCQINSTAIDHPTAEGWRQGHPRYLIIAEMFKNNKYIPFDE